MTSGVPQINRNRSGQTGTFDEAPMAVTIQIRQAAAKGMEHSPPSDGNVKADKPGPPAGPSRPTRPPKPAKATDKGNDAAAERTPPYAKESLAGDGWTQAREAARKMHRRGK